MKTKTPDYISAYDLQHRDGFSRSRQWVIELAEQGPVYWKNDSHSLHYPLDIVKELYPKADLSIYTHDRRYRKDGFEQLKKYTTEDWLEMRNSLRFILDEHTEYVLSANPDAMPNAKYLPNRDNWWEKAEIDNWLTERLPKILTGKEAYLLLQEKCPDSIQAALSAEYTIHEILKYVSRDDILLLLCFIVNNWEDGIWAFFETTNRAFVDLYFSQIFRTYLFFDRDNLPGVQVPPLQNVDNQTQDTTSQQPQDHGALTDLDEIKSKIEESLSLVDKGLLSVGLKPMERKKITALLKRLEEGTTYKDCYMEGNPKTESKDESDMGKQGKKYCQDAHKIVADKFEIKFDYALIDGRR